MFCSSSVFAQQLQLHYDPRHTIDPEHTKRNFLALYFEYFKSMDSGNAFIKPGSFLLKAQTEFTGDKNNVGQFYMQISQAFRFWKPKVFLQVQYNGGLGIAEPGSYGYYLTNAFSLGVAHPFQAKGRAFFNVYASYKYTAFQKPSLDIISAFFWLWFWRNFSNSFSGNFVAWTENRNHGDDFTKDKKGKQFFFYGDPQIWFRLHGGLSAGTRVQLYYHVLSEENQLQAYPSIGVRYQFR